MTWLAIIMVVSLSILKILTEPIFWAVVAVIGFQYHRMAVQKARFFHVPKEPIWKPLALAAIFGLLGGLAGSLIMLVMGVSPAKAGISYLWPVAVVLVLINPRFICFAYAGGIVSLSYLIFGWPQVNVPQVMGLVGVLHLVESLLILFSGHYGAAPMYLKTPGGRIMGGFTLQKLWPIPLVALTLNQQSGLALEPVIAALGYGDLALARRPGQKSRISALILCIFSVVLLGLAVLATKMVIFNYLAALFGPLGHELVIKIGREIEFKGKPYYVKPARGMKILDVVRGTPAHKGGLLSGDIIRSVNGIAVDHRREYEEALALGGRAYLEIEREGKGQQSYQLDLKWGQHPGIIPVPEGDENLYMEVQDKGILFRWLNRLKNFDKKD
jgi:hypothetical protein